jgi:hypothetical protein
MYENNGFWVKKQEEALQMRMKQNYLPFINIRKTKVFD